MERSPRRSVTWLLVAVTALCGLPTLVRLVGDHNQKWLVLAVSVVPLLVPALLVLVVSLVVLHRRLLSVLTALVLALNVVWLAPLYVANGVHRGHALAVMTANLRFGLADADAVVKLVREHRVDVLATEELTADAVQRLRTAGLETDLPFHELAPRFGPEGCGLWSRYPVNALTPFDAFFASPGALLHTPSGDVVVRVMHPFPTNLQGTRLYRRDYSVLTRQVRMIDHTVPTVLAGDFNATTDQEALRRLMGSQFRDASELAGSGFQRTWAPRVGWPALLHLDHVLVDRSLDARSTQVLELPGSDHSALLARLVVR